jgi:flagella basal body P-ring formation protein FlgA
VSRLAAVLIGLLALLPCASPAAERAPAAERVVVADRVAVSAEDVTLADLVTDAPSAWSGVALGKAPRPGSQRVLNRDWVLARARTVGADAALDLPETVVLTRGSATVEREAVVRAVETALAGKVGPGQGVRVTSVGLPGPLPQGDLTLSVCEPEGELTAPATVWVDVLSDGRKAGRAWARVEAGAGVGSAVVVLGRSARKGDVLGAADLAFRPAKSAARGPALVDPADAIGKRLVRGLSAGVPVTAADLETPPAVAKGDLVRLVARVGSVTAVTSGKALEAGRLGEGIRVENQASGRVVQGVLRERGLVDVAAE